MTQKEIVQNSLQNLYQCKASCLKQADLYQAQIDEILNDPNAILSTDDVSTIQAKFVQPVPEPPQTISPSKLA